MNCPMIMPCIEHAPMCDACKSGASTPIPTPRAAYRDDWYEDRDELVDFARHMVDADEWNENNLMEYLEKPWKWTDERDAWMRTDKAAPPRWNRRAAPPNSAERTPKEGDA
jgi:hypothetical protein